MPEKLRRSRSGERNGALMAAREELGVARRELAALLTLGWPAYLEVEKARELPLDIAKNLSDLRKRRKVLKRVAGEALVPNGHSNRLRQLDRPWLHRIAGLPLLAAGGYYAAEAFLSGLEWRGLAAALVTLLTVPWILHEYRCATCGRRVGIRGVLRRRCSSCGLNLE